ncbi:hypothetical protein V8G54_027489 [Vigna mungo]
MAHSQIQKVEANVHIKASAEQFHDVLCNRTHHIANIFPKVNGVLRDPSSPGTIYTEVVESIDKEKNKTDFKVIDGDLLKHYKNFKFIVQATPKEDGSVVNWVMEYEKQNSHTPDPYTLLELGIEMTKEIGAYLTK